MNPIKYTYAEEKYLPGFYQALDLVAREKIYIEMIEALPFEKIAEHQRKIIGTSFPSYYALDGERVIGWVDISKSMNPRYAHRGHLGMGIIQGYRGKGIGTKLLTLAIDHAKKCGLEKVELEVYATNHAARALYQKLGFQEVGYIKKARKLEEQYFDNILMEIFI